VFELAYPLWLILLAVPVVLAVVNRSRRRTTSALLRHANLQLFNRRATTLRVRLHGLLPYFSILALILLAVALARPRIPHLSEEVEGEGIDIVISLDISGSMQALDFHPLDRLAKAKEVIQQFIDVRHHDRIGLVLFAAKSFTQCPLTLDRSILRGFLEEVEVGLIDDGTAIGLGLATAVNRLKHSTAESKTIILLTDGRNNIPTLEPETAAEMARTLGVRVYTVGVGREGYVPFPVQTPFGQRTQQVQTPIDEELLQRIASLTGGSMYRAEDPEQLEAIFATIDRLETTRYETSVSTFYRELMHWFAGPALLLLVLELVLAATWLRRLP